MFGNQTKLNTELFVSLIMFDFVRKPNKNLRLDYISRKTDRCNEHKTVNFKGTFNRTGNYCKMSDTNDNYNVFLIFSFHDLVHHTSSPRQSGRYKYPDWTFGKFFLQNLSRKFILTVQSKLRKSNIRLCSIGQICLWLNFVRSCWAIGLNRLIKFD